MAAQPDEKKNDPQKDDPKDVEIIRAKVGAAEISAISVDTSIFDANKQRLDKGLFSKLRQFGRSKVDLIFPDAVWKEIELHLLESLANSKKRFSKDLVELCEFVGGDIEQVNALKEKMDGMPEIEKLCSDHLSNFIEESKAEILVAGQFVTIDEIMALYFEKKPPFQTSGPKRKEFPDAIALKTLERWAVKNKKNILLVSGDNDWKNYCNKSDRLFILQDLATALTMFHSPDDHQKILLEKLLQDLENDDSDLMKHIGETVKHYDWYRKIHIQADSQFLYEEDGIELIEVSSISYLDGNEGIHLVESDTGKISVSVRIIADLMFSINFSFDSWDSVDKEYMSMGSTSVDSSAEVGIEVTLNIYLDAGEIDDVEIDIVPDGFDLALGEIEPSWMSDPDHYE